MYNLYRQTPGTRLQRFLSAYTISLILISSLSRFLLIIAAIVTSLALPMQVFRDTLLNVAHSGDPCISAPSAKGVRWSERFQVKTLHVLIADDHKYVRDTLRSLLKYQRPYWEVSEAADGKSAVEVYRKTTPDVVILDIVMPVMNGVAAAYEMRRIDPSAKIVFISSHYTPGDASIMVHLLGAGAFIQKAEMDSALIPTITRVLNDESPPD
jgi:CheY-like chemotaxis protein